MNANPKSIAHLAIAVKSLKDVVPLWEKAFGIQASAVEEVTSQKVRTQFLVVGGLRLEFLEPTSSDSPISGSLDKRGNSFHHLAIEVDGIDEQLAALKQSGFSLINEKSVSGADDCKVGFLHPKALGGLLVELVEHS